MNRNIQSETLNLLKFKDLDMNLKSRKIIDEVEKLNIETNEVEQLMIMNNIYCLCNNRSEYPALEAGTPEQNKEYDKIISEILKMY